MNQKLNLPKSNLERIISIYRNYQESARSGTKQSAQTESTERKRFAEILNLSDSPTADEVKKAYRNLARQHHPDVFATASEAQQLIAKDKFRQIQEAYEFWKKELAEL